MAAYRCDDGNAEIEIEADSAREAAQEYVTGGDWGARESTVWVSVLVTPVDDGEITGESERIKVAIDPTEPDCVDADGHDWCSPHEIVGGCAENPGVFAAGGGVIIKEVCARCGLYRRTNTWAQDPEDGEQDLESVEYGAADAESLEWVEGEEE